MSTFRAESTSEKRTDRLMTALLVALIVPLVLAAIVFRHPVVTRAWPTVTAQILETRVVAVGAEEHPFSAGTIRYQIEAHVTYDLRGKHFDRWLPASGIKRDKAYLESWLSQKKSKVCNVRWNPKNPSDAEAVLE